MTTLLGNVFAVLVVLALMVFMTEEYLRTRELVSPWTMFLGITIIDVFVPAILYINFGMIEHPYIPIFNNEDMIDSMIIFAVAILFFSIGYFGIGGYRGKRWQETKLRSTLADWRIYPYRIYVIMLFSGAWYLMSIIVTIKRCGSFSLFLSRRFLRVYGQSIDYDDVLELLLLKFAPIMLATFLMLVGVLFYLRAKHNHNILWGVVLPFIGWLFTITTFYRGSQLVYFIMLLMIVEIRAKEQRLIRMEGNKHNRNAGFNNMKRIFYLMFLAVFLFSSYGAIRNFYSFKEWKVPKSAGASIFAEAKRFIRGEGIIGFTWIINSYPDKVDYLGGKTFYDMFLLPIPRAIYKSKPKWYGISDITRGMGGPSSTQDAVTMPGELYANFGPLGIPLIMFFGGIFGLVHRYRYHARLRFAYMSLLPAVMLTTLWMSFTGFVNNMLPFPFMFMVLVIIIRKSHSASRYNFIVSATR